MEDDKRNIEISTFEKRATIPAPADFTAPENLYNRLIDIIRSYHPSTDISMIEKAYQLANNAHKINFVNPRTLYYPSFMCGNYFGRTGIDKKV